MVFNTCIQGHLYNREVTVCAQSSLSSDLSSCWERLVGRPFRDTVTSSYPCSGASQLSTIRTCSCPRAYTTCSCSLIFPSNPHCSGWSQYIYTDYGVCPHFCIGLSCYPSLCPQFHFYITGLCCCLYYHGTANDSY